MRKTHYISNSKLMQHALEKILDIKYIYTVDCSKHSITYLEFAPFPTNSTEPCPYPNNNTKSR